MSRFQVFRNELTLKAVDMDQFTAPDEVTDYLNEGYESLGFVSANSKQQAIENANTASSILSTNTPEAMRSSKISDIGDESKYKTAQLISKIISGFGWLTFASGIFIILAALSSGSGRYGFDLWHAISLATPGFITLVSGLFLVATGQVMKATLDNADHTFYIYSHLKQK
ncbi:hypothetical protein [Vibrio mexicanus]|uniref:hypothetical protein n=1 Tax=Vibrio mexicanus TaxID=1004326 RepID=UPI00063C088F|nr:hypothetical protein [Vibrio mexicanus]